MVESVVSIAIVALGLTAGALLAEACVLVPFWRGERPEAFLDWYRRHAALLVRFFGPLEVASVALIGIAAGLAWWTHAPGRVQLYVSAALTLAVLASFPLYFGAANARFADGTLPPTGVADALKQWATWHWVRTLAGIAAFALAVASLHG